MDLILIAKCDHADKKCWLLFLNQNIAGICAHISVLYQMNESARLIPSLQLQLHRVYDSEVAFTGKLTVQKNGCTIVSG